MKTQRELVEDAIASLEVLKDENASPFDSTEILLSFGGAGVLKEAGVFKVDQSTCPRWVHDATSKIKTLLTISEWDSLQNSGMLNSHYTSPGVIKVMWEYLAQFLSSKDSVLDPGCGTGGFFMHKPQDLKFRYVGVEKCPVACAIAKKAHGLFGANFYENNFVDWNYPLSFNGIIGNVPFTDGNDWLKHSGKKFNIGLHAQFVFLASLKLKPGGVMALLTSTSTLDARGKDYRALREHLARSCELLKAIRLPCNGGVHIGKTQVTTDLIVLRKREHSLEDADSAGWIKSIDSGLIPPSGSEVVYINEWFLDNPNYLIGVPSVSKLRGKNGNPAYGFALDKSDSTDVLHELQLRLNQQTKEKTMTTTPATTIEQVPAWQKFEIKYVDSKGKIPGCEAIQLHFPEKPPKNICDALGQARYTFRSNGTKYWFAYLTPGVEEWTINTLLKKYASSGAKITAPKVGEQATTQPIATAHAGKVGIADLISMMREMSLAVNQIQQKTDATTEVVNEMRSQINEMTLVSAKDTEMVKDLQQELEAKNTEIAWEKQKTVIAQTIADEWALKDKAHLAKIKELEAIVASLQAQIDEWGLNDSSESIENQFPSLDNEDEEEEEVIDNEATGFPSLDDEDGVIVQDDEGTVLSATEEDEEEEEVIDDWKIFAAEENNESKNV